MQFVKDMEIKIDKPRVVETWKKFAHNNSPHLFEDFRMSLQKLALGSVKYQVEQCTRKRQHIRNALTMIEEK
jgi:hypothetical protein